jgi:hypothetical protein
MWMGVTSLYGWTQLVDGLGGSKLAMPVEIVQFCWKYNLQRLENLPEVKGCKVSNFTLVAVNWVRLLVSDFERRREPYETDGILTKRLTASFCCA